MTTIRISCPQCHITGDVDARFAGRSIRCNKCGMKFNATASEYERSPLTQSSVSEISSVDKLPCYYCNALVDVGLPACPACNHPFESYKLNTNPVRYSIPESEISRNNLRRYTATMGLSILFYVILTGILMCLLALDVYLNYGEPSLFFIILLLTWKIGIVTVSFLQASEKGRDPILWGAIEVLSSCIGTIVLLLLPYTRERKHELIEQEARGSYDELFDMHRLLKIGSMVVLVLLACRIGIYYWVNPQLWQKDRIGLPVIPFRYAEARSFSNGLAEVKTNEDEGWIVIPKPGNQQNSLSYTESNNTTHDLNWYHNRGIIDGLTVIEKRNKYGVIAKTGKLIIPCIYDDIIRCPHGYFFVEQRSKHEKYSFIVDKWSLIDTNGRVITSKKYDDADGFYDGLAAVKYDGQAGFIDLTGKEVIPLKFSEVDHFHEGLAQVAIGGMHGYIDKTGKEVIPLKYEDSYEFSEGLAAVKYHDRWGYISRGPK